VSTFSKKNIGRKENLRIYQPFLEILGYMHNSNSYIISSYCKDRPVEPIGLGLALLRTIKEPSETSAMFDTNLLAN
jgi:hypothetical protein